MCYQLNDKIDLPSYEEVLNASQSKPAEQNPNLQRTTDQNDKQFFEQRQI